ncbi:MAG: VCBS repeat-containing protein, partial [Verrucomicrobiota bacterium]|nr:VCBS repeat-containing protein [Verrucomicrobiota bacterium]
MEATHFSVLLGCIYLLGCSPAEQPNEQATTSATPQSELMEAKVDAAPGQAALQTLANEQVRFDQTVFRHEVDAQAYESAFVALWDRLRSTEPFEVLRQFPFIRLELLSPSEWKPLPLGMPGIRQASLDGDTIPLDHPAYLALLDELKSAGWKIIQTEWHHSEFRPGKNGQAPQSVVSFEIHSTNTSAERRAIVKGQLEVTWTPHKTNSGLRIPGTIKVRDTTITDYTGKPAFTELLQIDPKKVDAKLYPRVSPLIVYDLNQDGLPEILLAGCNLVYWNQGSGRFQHEPMLRNPIMLRDNLGRVYPSPLGAAGILSDFNGDGHVDFVSTGKEDGLLRLWAGSAGGQFTAKPSVCFQGRYENQHTMTAADIDLDGDLDLFVGQWKQPYLRGSMPTPYYDANDGYPDTLLL